MKISVKRMIFTVIVAMWVDAVCSQSVDDPNVGSETPAKTLFGGQNNPTPLPGNAIGSYSRGCLAGAQALAVTGYGWQLLGLSRNRYWAHPSLVKYIERFAKDARDIDGWSGLFVGDISQARGGPMLTGHKSHQIGLDVDIWLRAAPDRSLTGAEREHIRAVSMRKSRFKLNTGTWTEQHAVLLKRAASYPQVARIFVHPVIKKELCEWAGTDRSWLTKIRAWYGHHYHFHVRLKCPAGNELCENQMSPHSGDGCGPELAWWLSDEAYKPVGNNSPHSADPLMLTDLPSSCRSVLLSN